MDLFYVRDICEENQKMQNNLSLTWEYTSLDGVLFVLDDDFTSEVVFDSDCVFCVLL